jgi:hypothetical protein
VLSTSLSVFFLCVSQLPTPSSGCLCIMLYGRNVTEGATGIKNLVSHKTGSTID